MQSNRKIAPNKKAIELSEGTKTLQIQQPISETLKCSAEQETRKLIL